MRPFDSAGCGGGGAAFDSAFGAGSSFFGAASCFGASSFFAAGAGAGASSIFSPAFPIHAIVDPTGAAEPSATRIFSSTPSS